MIRIALPFYSTRYYTGVALLIWILSLCISDIPFKKLTYTIWAIFLITTLIRPNDPRWGQSEYYMNNVKLWKDCYEEHHDIELCNKKTQFSIQPDPNNFDLVKKWEILRQIKPTSK